MIFRGCAAVAVAFALGGCDHTSGLYGHDEMQRYAQRLDTITDSAGDAKEVNRATQSNPWPRYVADRRIPANGERMTRAVERYRHPPAPQTGGGAAAPAGGATPPAGGATAPAGGATP